MNILLANALPTGGTIGIVSPASPYDTYSDVLRGIAWWEAHDYRVKLAEGVATGRRKLFLTSIPRSLPPIPSLSSASRISRRCIPRSCASPTWQHSTAHRSLRSATPRCPSSPASGSCRCSVGRQRVRSHATQTIPLCAPWLLEEPAVDWWVAAYPTSSTRWERPGSSPWTMPSSSSRR